MISLIVLIISSIILFITGYLMVKINGISFVIKKIDEQIKKQIIEYLDKNHP
jgi:hypothetical protein